MANEIEKIQTQLTDNYVEDIRAILHKAREYTYRTINNVMVQAYWLIGERIIRQEQRGNNRAEYGSALIDNLSRELASEFGSGFSAPNLRNMRQFYRSFPDFQICYTLCSKLSWSHNRLIMRVDDADARMYYLNEAIENHWSTRQLERNIESFYYQRTISSQHRGNAIQKQIEPEDFIKDPYVLEFIGLPPFHTRNEKGLEDRLLDHFQQFMLELGKGFSFIGRQYRISTETSHFYIDLVFYNYILKCFVLIDLKDTKLVHKDIGQMDMYIRMFDDMKRQEGDNPTVGILLCAERDETVVKYSVANGSRQLFVSKYLPYMPTEEEIRNQIERRQEYTN